MLSKLNPLGQAWQDVGRFRTIITVLIRHGFGELISRMNLQDNFVTRMLGRESPVEKNDLTVAQRLCKVAQDLGPTFIKLGQILSTRPDLIPEDFIQEFKTLQSNAAPLPYIDVKNQIESSLGKSVDELFESIDEKPLASASMAQVHIAHLDKDTEVVLKVLRPGIREALTSDLSILKFLARQMTTLFPDTELFDPVGIAEEFEKALSKELDFTVELRNIERFARNFEDNPDVHIPKVYREYSCDSVIVMERIMGVKITEVKEDRKALVRRLLKAVFEMLFVHTLFHGDMHPGNIMVQKDGAIALIDFGLVGRLTPKMRDYITDLMLGIVQHDHESVSETLFEIGIKRVAINYDRFQADVASLMDEHLLGATMADIEFGVLVQEILDGAMRHHIAVPPDYTMMFKALITAEGVGKELDPEMDIFKEIEPYVKNLLKDRYSPEALLKQAIRYGNNLRRFMHQFPITARQVLLGIENGRIKFGLDTEQLALLMEEYKRQGARKLAVAMSGIMLFLATLSLEHGTPWIFGLSAISFIGYVVGGLLAAWVLVTIMREG